jgi:hypothetical protein
MVRDTDLHTPWRIEFFQRHVANDPSRAVPARAFLDTCPVGARADMLAVITAVAEAPPPRFAGGGKWEAMHGTMKGFYENRVTGPQRRQYRLFCMLEREGMRPPGPAVVAITGMSKPIGRVFSARDYGRVRRLGEEFKGPVPRSVAR